MEKSTSDTQPAAQLATRFIPKYLDEQKTQRKCSFETINVEPNSSEQPYCSDNAWAECYFRSINDERLRALAAIYKL